MKQVKTAKGRVIDMSALAKANEERQAVSPGNIKMNARGDRLDSSGNVKETVQARSRQVHDTKTAPEKKKLSEAPGAPREDKEEKKKAERREQVEASGLEPKEIRRDTKVRDNGTKYIEIEYDDGSMDVKDL